MRHQIVIPAIILLYCFAPSATTAADKKAVTVESNETIPAPKGWDMGMIYLNDGNYIRGKLYYNPEKKLVLVENQGKILTYTPENLIRFTVYDKMLSAQRNYISILPDNALSKQKFIFEIVLDGSLSLLRHQKSKTHYEGYYDQKIQQFVGYSSDFIYYFLYKNKIYQLKNFKKQYIEIVGESIYKINAYIKNNKLKYSSVPHQVKLINFFNTL
jgi:hypothetical protein